MAQTQEKTRWQRLLERLKEAMSYRAQPGCTACLTPIMDETGKPVTPHCSLTQDAPAE